MAVSFAFLFIVGAVLIAIAVVVAVVVTLAARGGQQHPSLVGCPHCGRNVLPQSSACPNCGQALQT